MNLYDEQGQYQGFYSPQTGIFTQSSQILHPDAIKINSDTIETLRLQGCKFIEASTLKQGGHVEPYYITFDRFMEVASNEWDNDNQRFDLVYHVTEVKELDERREMRESLQP